ncbi:MAG: hypothetical protein Roseis2KO_05040 [Roseivirga sp.]
MFRILKCIMLLTVLSVFACQQQPKETPEIKPSAFENLLGEGYEIFYSDTLRFDQNDMVVAVLKRQNEDSLIWEAQAEVPRPLLILKKQNSGKYDIALRNDKAILCGACGGVLGDPLDMIEVDGNSVTVSHFGGSRYRWTRHIRFEFMKDQGSWFLSSDKGVSFDSLNPESEMEEIAYTEIDRAGPISFEAFDVTAYQGN